MDDFIGQYAHGFSVALEPVLCCVGLKEPNAVGFRNISDTLLFYRMMQGHFRQLRFWARYGSTSGDASFEFREGETGKSPRPSKTKSEGRGTRPRGCDRNNGRAIRKQQAICRSNNQATVRRLPATCQVSRPKRLTTKPSLTKPDGIRFARTCGIEMASRRQQVLLLILYISDSSTRLSASGN